MIEVCLGSLCVLDVGSLLCPFASIHDDGTTSPVSFDLDNAGVDMLPFAALIILSRNHHFGGTNGKITLQPGRGKGENSEGIDTVNFHGRH